jgi:hypothetical protein
MSVPEDGIKASFRIEAESGIRLGHVAAADLVRVKNEVDEQPHGDLADLYERMLECFQGEYGKIADFYRYKGNWAVIQTLKNRRWPLRLLNVRPSPSIFPVFKFDPSQHHGDLVASDLVALDRQSGQLLRGADRIYLADEITGTLAQILYKLEGRTEDLTQDDLDVYEHELKRLHDVFEADALRAIRITYLEGMLLGLIPVMLLGTLLAWLLSRADIRGLASHDARGSAIRWYRSSRERNDANDVPSF